VFPHNSRKLKTWLRRGFPSASRRWVANVKAEFEGIGEAGKRGFGKASREMEIANAKLARFVRCAKIAAGIILILLLCLPNHGMER